MWCCHEWRPKSIISWQVSSPFGSRENLKSPQSPRGSPQPPPGDHYSDSRKSSQTESLIGLSQPLPTLKLPQQGSMSETDEPSTAAEVFRDLLNQKRQSLI